MKLKQILREWTNYIVIATVSLLVMLLMPFVGTSLEITPNLPNTPLWWAVWITVRLMVAVVNVLIFNAFMQQGKLNVKDNEKFKEACEILNKNRDKKISKPQSPAKWQVIQWAFKGSAIFLGTVISVFAISQAILQYDYTSLISYAITILLAIIFGVLQMRKAEAYWSEEFWLYAKMIEDDKNKEKNLNDNG